MNTSNIVRALSIASVLLAGSCAAPMNDTKVYSDPTVNHPITVEPSYKSLQMSYSGSSAELSPDDTRRFASFVQEYLDHGDGAISVSAPRGHNATPAMTYFAEQLARMGVPRTRILVGTHDAASADGRVEIGYISYSAHTDACGDWSHDAGETSSNLPMPDFGCSVQHNIAAMVSDPRDLVTPRGMDPSDPTRRQTVLSTYEKGQTTQAQQTAKQSASVSDVSTQ